MTSIAELISSGIAALQSKNPRAAVSAAKQLAQRVSISEDPQNVSEVSELGTQLSAVADLVTTQVGGPAPLVSAPAPAIRPDWQPEALPPQPDPMIRDATAAWVPLKAKFDTLSARKATVVADESGPNVQQFLAAAKDYTTALAAYKKQFRDWRGRNLPTVQVAARDTAIAKSLSSLPSSKPNPAVSRDAAAAYEELEILQKRAEELQLSTTGSNTRNAGRNTEFFTARDQYETALAAYNKKYKTWTGASKTNADVKALEASMRDITQKGIPALPERPTDPDIEEEWGYLQGLYQSLTASKQAAQAAMVAGKGTRDAAKNIQYRTNYERYVSALDEYNRSHKQYSAAEAAVMAEPEPLPTDPARVPNAPKGAKASWDALSGLYRDLINKQQRAREPRANNPAIRDSSHNSEYVSQLEAYNKALAAYKRSVKGWMGSNLVEAGKQKLHNQISAAVALPLTPPPAGPEFAGIRATYEDVNRLKQELLLDPTREAHIEDYNRFMDAYRAYTAMSDPSTIFKIMKKKADTSANPIAPTSPLGEKMAAKLHLQEAIQFGESLKKKELREDITDLKSRLALLDSFNTNTTNSNWRATRSNTIGAIPSKGRETQKRKNVNPIMADFLNKYTEANTAFTFFQQAPRAEREVAAKARIATAIAAGKEINKVARGAANDYIRNLEEKLTSIDRTMNTNSSVNSEASRALIPAGSNANVNTNRPIAPAYVPPMPSLSATNLNSLRSGPASEYVPPTPPAVLSATNLNSLRSGPASEYVPPTPPAVLSATNLNSLRSGPASEYVPPVVRGGSRKQRRKGRRSHKKRSV